MNSNQRKKNENNLLSSGDLALLFMRCARIARGGGLLTVEGERAVACVSQRSGQLRRLSEAPAIALQLF